MKEKTILNKVKALLGLEVKLEQMKLSDGETILEADAFEPGMEVMIVTADEQKIPLVPNVVGEPYELEDGRLLNVVTEGIIASIEMPSVEEETTQEQPVAEVPVEASKEPTPSAKKVVETTTKEMHFSAVDFEALEKECVELKKTIAELEFKLSEATIKPITFNPESQNKVQIDLSKVDKHTRLIYSLNNK